MHNLSVNEKFDSLSIGPPASKYPEIPGTGISPTSGGLADQLPISLTDSEDGDSHEETYSESSSIWSDEEIDDLSGPEATSENFPVGVDFSTSKVETAVLEALALNSNDNVINLEFSQIAKLPVFDGVAINCRTLYKSLDALSNRYLKRGLLDQAWMAVRMMELVQVELLFPTVSVRCNFQKARILRKQNNYEGSKECISQAISICKRFGLFGNQKRALKCRLFLGDTLLSQERYSEALHVFVEALIDQRGTWQGSGRGKVMAEIRKLHLKMNELGKMEEIILTSSIIGDLLDERGAMLYPHIFDIWNKFAQLGSGYSKLGLFGVADLCFEVPEPMFDVRWLPSASNYILRS
jgi:tetratricopeptide (TPR) repeat protein